MVAGKVYLIGTGPGDEQLLTLKAVNLLSKCTAVLYDRLGAANIFKYLKDDCKIYYCGKEPNCHYKTQEEINDMLVTLAKEGHIVGRVKGGDPYVFGRGGEEALRFFQEKIEFEVVPGITSAISVLNYAGIPITNRGIAQSFHVYTGKSAKKLNIEWESVVKSGGTIVFLMGLENLEDIVANLKNHGMDEFASVAVIMKGTTSSQKKVVGTLDNICEKVRDEGLKSPCIIVVGEVVKLNSSLNWYERKPLYGLNVCITRSKEQSKDICEKLLELGAQVTEINSLKIENRDYNMEKYLGKLEQYDFVVFTSVNSVNIFFDYLIKNRYDFRKIKAKFAAVGNATANAIENRGIICEVKSDEFVGEGLLEKLKLCVKEEDRILIPSSKISRDLLEKELLNLKVQVDRVDIYETVIGEARDVNAFDNTDIVVFTSPSTVRNMIKLVGYEKLKSKLCLSIGPITSGELKKNLIDCIVCDEYTTEGIIKKIRSLRNV